MPSSRRSSSAAGRAERMVSHNRYTSEQKRFFAVNLKLWNEKQITKDEVIERFKKKFKDPKFGYSQYRYLRQEVGRDVEFGAPLLQAQEQKALVVTVPQPASCVQGFPHQQPQMAPASQDLHEDKFSAPVADSPPFLQQDFSSGYGDFPDLEMLLENDAETIPAASVLPSTRGSTCLMPAQQQGQQHQHQHQQQQQPAATDVFECTGGGPCTLPVGAPHRHEPNGSIVFPNEKAIVGMIAMEKMLMGLDSIDPQILSTQSEPPVGSCVSGSDYTFTRTTSQQVPFTTAPDIPNMKTDDDRIFAGFEYESPVLQDPSTDLGTTTGGINIDPSLTDTMFDYDMSNQIYNSTSQGTAGGTDSMYLPTSMGSEYPHRNPWLSTTNTSDSNFHYNTSPGGLTNWSQASSYHLGPSNQAGIASPSRWTSQQLARRVIRQPVAAMTIPRRPAMARQQQNMDAGFGFGLGVGGMQMAYSPSTTGVVPSMWPQNRSPAMASKSSQGFDIKGAGGAGTPQ
ncbi:hypothetical protein M0657_002225 [Pyricularia oryzae]|uniref:Uncharacterized protein n=2 Tax=Pyricularia oryzae TaxID=318829 RepID=A0AA97P7D6_PYRO3|nr:hypothetical protein OOU_Y34scaffold00177g29 [Pyricularia oryzae Y34]KAI7929547.1 hypothetical protein M0657_002225 [Pyricularia oryzae]